MRQPRFVLAIAAVPVLLAGTACGGAGPAGRTSAGDTSPTAASTAAGRDRPSAGSTAASPDAGRPSGPAAPDGTPTASPAGPAPASSSPTVARGPSYVGAAVLPITAQVSPNCVLQGGTARLEVLTKPSATIGYVAVYAGEKSGALPPFGYGYGGNAHGESDSDGRFTSTWVVALNAPTGPARVTVVVGWKGKQRQIEVPFSVGGREAGGCGA